MARKRSPRDGGSVGERIRARRLQLGLSQREISTPGVSYAYISRVEGGHRTPSVKALRKLAPKLHTSVAWLETGEEDPAEQLAALVLEHRGQPLPSSALGFAQQILTRGAS